MKAADIENLSFTFKTLSNDEHFQMMEDKNWGLLPTVPNTK